MKIVFVSSARYPTEKAYGVTIGETAKAANKIGHESMILTLGSSGIDEYGNEYIGISNHILKQLEKTKNIKSKIAQKYFFNFKSLFFSQTVFKTIKFEEIDILWTRDIFLAFFNLFRRNGNLKLILEIHHIPKGFTNLILKLVILKSNNIVVTISEFHKAELRKTLQNNSIVIAPMSVPTHFFSHSKTISFPSQQRLRICFLGKYSSSGFSNGLESLLNSVHMLEEFDFKFNFTFIGLEPEFATTLQKMVEKLKFSNGKIEFISHVSHTALPEMLRGYDIGVIPYPESSYNNGRIPIKIFEYAACKVAILATKTTAHLRILDDSIATFYNNNEISNFATLVNEMMDNSDFTEKKIESSYNWAKKFDYQHRVSNVLRQIQNLE